MRKYLLLALSLMVASCSAFSNYMQHERIKGFWYWFVSEKYLFETATDSNRDERLNLILEHLSPISDGLALEVPKELHGVRDIIISADGDRNNFSIVQEIVNAAPAIPGWTVTAFRQKSKDDFVLTYDGLKFRLDR